MRRKSSGAHLWLAMLLALGLGLGLAGCSGDDGDMGPQGPPGEPGGPGVGHINDAELIVPHHHLFDRCQSAGG